MTIDRRTIVRRVLALIRVLVLIPVVALGALAVSACFSDAPSAATEGMGSGYVDDTRIINAPNADVPDRRWAPCRPPLGPYRRNPERVGAQAEGVLVERPRRHCVGALSNDRSPRHAVTGRGDQYRYALRAAANHRKSGAVKVVLQP